MLRGKGDGGAEQTRLRMDDDLDGDRRHHLLEPTLGGEPAAETRAWQELGNPRAKAAGNDDSIRAVCQRDVACDAAQDQAEAIKPRAPQAVGAGEGGRPT